MFTRLQRKWCAGRGGALDWRRHAWVLHTQMSWYVLDADVVRRLVFIALTADDQPTALARSLRTTTHQLASVCSDPLLWKDICTLLHFVPGFNTGQSHMEVCDMFVKLKRKPLLQNRLRNLTNECTEIPEAYFQDCHALTIRKLPRSLTSIGARAFAGCRSLQLENTVDAPHLETVGVRAFDSCCQLQIVTLNAPNLKVIRDSAFYGCHELKLCTLNAPQIKAIDAFAFYRCAALRLYTPLNTPELTTIGDWAFAQCLSLECVTLHAPKLTSVGCGFTDVYFIRTA